MLRFMTAGESHGESLVSILEGMPSGLFIDVDRIDKELKRRMSGYGRGDRMKIESDSAHVVSGVRKNITIGSPIAILVKNKDFSINTLHSITKARPGHADLAGAMKFHDGDIRNILERSSARETAARVAGGAVAKIFLSEFGIDILSHVLSIGAIESDVAGLTFSKIKTLIEKSELSCADKNAEKLMKDEIDNAKLDGDSLGGVVEVIAKGVPAGLGSYSQWDKRLSARFSLALSSIPAVKAVEIGGGFRLARLRGSKVHDEISYKKGKFVRKTNNAGGIEGGISNGEDIILRLAMKPIATLVTPLNSTDIHTKKEAKAQVERADVCAVPACGVVAESMTAIELANAMLEKFGGDSMAEVKRNYAGYVSAIGKI